MAIQVSTTLLCLLNGVCQSIIHDFIVTSCKCSWTWLVNCYLVLFSIQAPQCTKNCSSFLSSLADANVTLSDKCHCYPEMHNFPVSPLHQCFLNMSTVYKAADFTFSRKCCISLKEKVFFMSYLFIKSITKIQHTIFVEWCILFHCIIMNICVPRVHIELQKCTKSTLCQKLVKFPTENQQQTLLVGNLTNFVHYYVFRILHPILSMYF